MNPNQLRAHLSVVIVGSFVTLVSEAWFPLVYVGAAFTVMLVLAWLNDKYFGN